MKGRFFRKLADLRVAILILLLISLASVIGTVIEQDQSIEIYKLNYPLKNPLFGFLSWEFILRLGFDHVYRTWWFLSLILLLGCSLVFCSFLQQLPSLKIARRCQFFRRQSLFYRLKTSTILTKFSFPKTIAKIKEEGYSIFQQKNMVYCYKGLIGRIAPIIVHFSMILILIGTIVGSLFGFKAQEIIPKTEHFSIQNILASGSFSRIPQTSTRINDFWITYTKTKTVSQFYSDISILDLQGNERNRKTISVNYPLVERGLYYYQTDWDLIGLRIQKINQTRIEYPLIKIFGNSNKIWLAWVSKDETSQDGIISFIDNLEGYSSIYNTTGQFLGNLELYESLSLEEPIRLVEIISSTGLQIKTDPGIPMIYCGFFFLMISTLVSYITYSQIWIIQQNKQLFIGGNTSRAVFDFELEFFEFVK